MRKIASVAATVALLSGCGGGGTDPVAAPSPAASSAPAVADCYLGRGTQPDGTALVASLRLKPDGRAVTGTYVSGPTVDRGLSYAVQGTLADGRLDSTFTAMGQGLRVTGIVNPTSIRLDNPGGKFTVTDFTAGC